MQKGLFGSICETVVQFPGRNCPALRSASHCPYGHSTRVCRKSPASSADQAANDIVAMAKRIQNTLSSCDQIQNPTRGLFILSLQRVVDSMIAGALTEEAFEWLAK